ncbi:unnamed protein product, partial [Ectocarpus sp. 13 AM-2016]
MSEARRKPHRHVPPVLFFYSSYWVSFHGHSFVHVVSLILFSSPCTDFYPSIVSVISFVSGVVHVCVTEFFPVARNILPHPRFPLFSLWPDRAVSRCIMLCDPIVMPHECCASFASFPSTMYSSTTQFTLASQHQHVHFTNVLPSSRRFRQERIFPSVVYVIGLPIDRCFHVLGCDSNGGCSHVHVSQFLSS